MANHDHPTHSHEHGNCSHGDHDHASPSLHVHPVVKNMRVALVLNVLFTVIEFIGGLYTNSVAILSDAIHDLGDSIAIAAALVLEKQSGQGRTSTFSYGKRRFSTLAAFLTSLILLAGSIVILTEAVPRFFAVEAVKTTGVLWLAVAGILFNGLAILRLRTGERQSLNQRAVMLHLVEDALGWIAVLAGAVIMYFTHWYWIDPLLSVGIALFILYNATRNILATLKIFLQAAPASVDEQTIITELKKLPEVTGVHDVHSWTMDGEKNILSLHLVVKQPIDTYRLGSLLERAREIIVAQNVQHPTIQVEPDGMSCGLANC
ncbi:MAG: cation transporter [Niastella sp.]|nr:cation transporter [Niastella sp.]